MKGLAAFIAMTALIMTMGALSGLGVYDALGVGYGLESADQDVQAAADALMQVDYQEGGSDAVLQGPLAAVRGPVAALQSIRSMLFNTSGVLKLLFGAPGPIAEMVERFFQISYGLATILFVRGVRQ